MLEREREEGEREKCYNSDKDYYGTDYDLWHKLLSKYHILNNTYQTQISHIKIYLFFS